MRSSRRKRSAPSARGPRKCGILSSDVSVSDDLSPVRPVEVLRIRGERRERRPDFAAAEEPLDIRLHGESFAIVMRTPGDDQALAAGFLFAERVIRAAADIGAV